MQELRCPSCNYLLGFSETAIRTDGLLCHFCSIEQHCFGRQFSEEYEAELQAAEDKLDPFTDYDKWTSSPSIRTAAINAATRRQNQLLEFTAFIPKLHYLCDKKE